MRRSPLPALVLTVLLLVAPGAAQAAVPDRATPADPAAVLAQRTARSGWPAHPLAPNPGRRPAAAVRP
ncbi:hypothetical protein ACWCO3_31540, partial [Micromonospora sp. NPDC002411]